jgi:mono/diheme cytochrome c family protein
MRIRLTLLLTGALAAAMASSLFPAHLAARQEGGAGNKMPGQSVYEGNCSRCHGSEGRDGKAPTLVPFRWNYKQALDIVRHGGACGMPAFPETDVSDEEVKQIVDYMKTLN